MAARIFYQEDCNLSLLDGKTIAVIGYGSQAFTKEANHGQKQKLRVLKYIQQQKLQRKPISL